LRFTALTLVSATARSGPLQGKGLGAGIGFFGRLTFLGTSWVAATTKIADKPTTASPVLRSRLADLFIFASLEIPLFP
jgi:hypothetical protein